MSWSTDLDDLMPDTIWVSSMSGFDGYGTFTYGSASTYTARVVRKQRPVKTFEGTEELATAMAWVKSTSTFGPGDRYLIPTGSTFEEARLLAVESYPDEDGTHHVRLSFG